MRSPLFPPHTIDEIGLDVYINYLDAMTGENLYTKTDIAIQLAWRDQEIARLKSQEASNASSS